MKKIEAKILYEDIAEDKAGLYVWTTPSAGSVVALSRLLKAAPFKVINATGWHCTVLHCTTELPEIDLQVPDFAYSGFITSIDSWVDHKERNIFVARIDCPELIELNAKLQKVGLVHAHHEYNPHITLCKDAELNSADRIWLTATNTLLQNKPMPISFNGNLMASTVA